MENQIEIVKDVADGMIGIGGIPNNEEFYAEFNSRVVAKLGIKTECKDKTSKKELNLALRKTNVSGSDLVEILKSDSVYRLLRYGVKSPSSCSMDDCEDDHYYTLYNIVTELRQYSR